MTKQQTKPELSREEHDLLDSYERDEWWSVDHLQEQREQYSAYASATLEADGIVSIVLPAQDLKALRRKATEAGVSHQILIARIVHQYASGQ